MPNVVLKCTHSGGSSVLRDLTSESTLQDLQTSVQNITQIEAASQKLKGGYPPKLINTSEKTALLSDLGIKSGDTVHVERGAPSSNTSSAPSSNLTPAPSSNGPSNPTPHHSTRERSAAPVSRSIVRKVVPADNSCLFASLGFLFQGDTGQSIATALRCVVGDIVLSCPEEFPDVLLGKKREEYVKWIQNSQIWGGGIELAALARHFATEIHVVDTQSLRIDKFGQDLGCSDKTYVIYDGIHYDPLYEPTPAGPVTVFLLHDSDIEAAAMLVAANAKKAHNYTDLANFTLKCGTCGLGIAGEQDARHHAKETGHQNFQEYN
ncbi:hypothetical protein ACHWQZ_G015327 [Mnemiopsis leidyi]